MIGSPAPGSQETPEIKKTKADKKSTNIEMLA